MSDIRALSLATLPIDLIYRILDNLDPLEILLSVQDVCTRLNAIIESYHQYKVNFIWIFKKSLYQLHHMAHSNCELAFFSIINCSQETLATSETIIIFVSYTEIQYIWS